MNFLHTKGIILLFALLPLCNAFAAPAPKTTRYTITGQVVDSVSRKGIEYATVALLGDSAKILTAAAADASGKFSLETRLSGKFTLSASSIGYVTTKKPVTVGGEKTRIDAGTILLPAGVEIAEVTVTAQKPLIKVDAEKLVYSVEADPEAQTSTLADILRKVPQLSVDAEDNVRLNGQSDYKVLVNGKSSTLFSSNFKDVIKSMPANTIKDIQVITSPSTKYEAEGAAGIINIITTRKTTNGYSGRIGGGYSSFDSYNGNAFLTAQIGKFNFSARYWLGRYGSPETTNYRETDYFNSQTGAYTAHSVVSGNGTGKRTSQGLSVEASYEIDTLNLLTLSLWGFDGSNENNSFSLTNYVDAEGNPTRDLSNLSRSKNTYRSISGSFDYQRSFKKPEQTLTFSYKLDNNPNKSDLSNIVEVTRGDYPSYNQRSKSDALGSEHTLQVDYFEPVTKVHQIEAGVKYVLRINTNESDVQRLMDGVWEPYDQGQNDLDYTQHIMGAYGGYQYKKEKFNAKAGVRFEGTVNDGTSKTFSDGDTDFDNRQFNFIPYVNVGYQLAKTQSLRFSYTQRLRRPGIWHLNPYVNDQDPMNIRMGNPNLKSVVLHTFNAGFSKFASSWNLNLGLRASLSNNNISEITTVDNKGISTTTYQNIGKEQNYGIDGSYSYRLKTRFNIYCNANVNYNIIEDPSRGLSNEGFSYGGQMGVGVGLWKSANVQLNGGVFSSRISLQGKGPLFYYTSAGLTQKLFKEKLDLNASVSEPFNRFRKFSNRTEDPSFRQYGEFRMISRRFNVGIGYRFGKLDAKVKKASRSIDNDDKMGGGGEGGQGAQ